MPKVSVILPTYNRADQLVNAIESVLNQTYTNFELIIVDDGSTDSTQEVLRDFKTDSRVKVFQKENGGASRARNLGLEKATGEYLAFQDSDDIWYEDKLSKQIAVFVSNPDIGLVYCDMLRVLDSGKSYYWKAPDVLNHDVVNPKTNDYQVLGLGMATVLVKRDVMQIVGGFDLKLPRFIDLDWFVRLSKVTKFFHIKEALVKYNEMPGISSDPGKAAEARMILLEKYGDEIHQNDKYISTQWAKIAAAYWKVGDTQNARSFAKRAFLKSPMNVRQSLKLLVILTFFPGVKRLMPDLIVSKYW